MFRSLPFFSSYVTSSLEAKRQRGISSLSFPRSLPISLYLYSPLSLHLPSSRSLVLTGPSGDEAARAVQPAQPTPSSAFLSTTAVAPLRHIRPLPLLSPRGLKSNHSALPRFRSHRRRRPAPLPRRRRLRRRRRRHRRHFTRKSER